MIRINHTIARMAIAMLLVAATAGCQSTSNRAQRSWQADSFDEGIGRPPTAKTLRVMSRILTAQGKTAQAEFVLKRLIHDYPTQVIAYNDLASLQMNDNRMNDAIETLSAALEHEPEDATTLNNLGMCYLRMGDVEMALTRFRAASQHAPGEAKFVANEAVALGWLGHYDQSLAAFASILPAGESHYNVAVLCESREDFARAAEELVKAHDADQSLLVDDDLARVGRKLVRLEGTGVETLRTDVAPTPREVTATDVSTDHGGE